MDNIEVCRHKNEEIYNVYIVKNKGQVYYNENLNKDKFNDDYAVYINGDNPLIILMFFQFDKVKKL